VQIYIIPIKASHVIYISFQDSFYLLMYQIACICLLLVEQQSN